MYVQQCVYHNEFNLIHWLNRGLQTKCPYLISRHKPRSDNKYKCVITHVHCILTLDELSKYCDVEGESAFLTCPRFLQKLRSK